MQRGTLQREPSMKLLFEVVMRFCIWQVPEWRINAGQTKEKRDPRQPGEGRELLCKALATIPNEISVVVSSSAIGWYGPDPQLPNPKPFIETAPAYDDFLGSTCEAWEQSLIPLTDMGKRVVFLRTGIVLATEEAHWLNL